MQTEQAFIERFSKQWPFMAWKELGGNSEASEIIEITAKTIREIFRFFEPAFFNGDFILCKHLKDTNIISAPGELLYDRNVLLNKEKGVLIIQVFSDGKLMFWENQPVEEILKEKNVLIYHYRDHKEYFCVNEKVINVTTYNSGSQFADQFHDLKEALKDYAQSRILKSTCSHFTHSWADPKRIFFTGGGSGSNVPEKHMQLSLHDFLSVRMSKGIDFESSREFNINADYRKPKPVDIKLTWREANRTALIEIKFIGTVKKQADGEIYSHPDSRANEGIVQLKDYHDKMSTDQPRSIIKSFLVVIDGRRKGVKAHTTTINVEDGMHFRDTEISIDADKAYHTTIKGFEKPIKMFAEPICN